MTRWRIGEGAQFDHVFKEDGFCVAQCYGSDPEAFENATAIVRDHNRAEACEAMREALQNLVAVLSTGPEYYTESHVDEYREQGKAALAHAEQAESQ